MQKESILFKVGETFKYYSTFRVIERVIIENTKVTFEFTYEESTDKQKGWATFRKQTQVKFK